jgi:hypothetical protein
MVYGNGLLCVSVSDSCVIVSACLQFWLACCAQQCLHKMRDNMHVQVKGQQIEDELQEDQQQHHQQQEEQQENAQQAGSQGTLQLSTSAGQAVQTEILKLQQLIVTVGNSAALPGTDAHQPCMLLLHHTKARML